MTKNRKYQEFYVNSTGYSRYSVYLLTLNRKQKTLFHALDSLFEKLGEFPKTVISDNMKTIMDEARTNYASGKINLRKNMDIYSGTGKSPITLLNIEKDSLQPLPTKAIRSPHQRYRQLHKVNPTYGRRAITIPTHR